MGLKKSDFTIQTGTVPIEFTRAVKVKDNTVNMTVKLMKNHKKKTFSIKTELLWSHVTGRKAIDAKTLELLNELTHEAIKQGTAWLKEIREADEDPDQMKIEVPD